jgi:hypothetical protein
LVNPPQKPQGRKRKTKREPGPWPGSVLGKYNRQGTVSVAEPTYVTVPEIIELVTSEVPGQAFFGIVTGSLKGNVEPNGTRSGNAGDVIVW